MNKISILFLHHSTGNCIWNGESHNIFSRLAGKIHPRIGRIFYSKPQLPRLFKEYKDESNEYSIKKMVFPKHKPYGWKNYPFDYYNIWVKNGGESPFMEEPTLEILTREYDLIIFKHCFPVCNIKADSQNPDIDSELKTLANYKLQYEALRKKLLGFSKTRFIIITGAAQVKSQISEEEAIRANEFFRWVREEWNKTGDNIYLWDMYDLQTEGGLYFNESNAVSPFDSHPDPVFSGKAAKLLFSRIIDVLENNGTKTNLRGERKN